MIDIPTKPQVIKMFFEDMYWIINYYFQILKYLLNKKS